MAIGHLTAQLCFPPPETADRSGLLAVGGDASPARLLLAYSQGIFPWPSPGLPLLWFSPEPRFILPLDRIHLGRSLRKAVRGGRYTVRADENFSEVVERCQRAARPGQDGTWITGELIEGFTALHRQGFAHSVESYCDGRLVGGLYGLSLGAAFFGESMFAAEPNASKIALVTLAGTLRRWGFPWIDCQTETNLFRSFGAGFVPRAQFLVQLREAVARPTRKGPWRSLLTPEKALSVLLPQDAAPS